jgi:hypothetical protein
VIGANVAMSVSTGGSFEVKLCILVFFEIIGATAALAQNCPGNAHWVRAYHRHAYYRASGVFVSAANVVAHCQQNSTAYDYLKSRINNGRPPNWPNKSENSVSWPPEEIERVVEALSELPQDLWLSGLKGVYRMDKSKDFSNPASNTDGNIALYDEAFAPKRDRPLARIIAHEIAHKAYEDLSDEDKNAYRFATNWFNMGSDLRPDWRNRRTGSEFIRPEGKMNPEEAFAEDVEAYLFDRSLLKRRVPYADMWIKNHFGDKFKIEHGGS